MPHTSRRKPPKVPRKRIQISDASGWTTIIKGSKPQQHHQPLVFSAPVAAGPSGIPAGLTIQKVNDTFQRYLKPWKQSDCYKELKNVLEQSVLTSQVVKLERCVCLGLGSFTGGATVEASLWELAALVSILEILSTKFSIATVYMQDPLFNRLDEDFLQGLGYFILPTPEAFERLTFGTFLFAPHLEWPYYIQALRVATPSLCIGNSVREYFESFQESPRSKELKNEETLSGFVERSETVDMPVFDRALWYMSTSIYWRKERRQRETNDGEIQEKLEGLELESKTSEPQ